MRTIWPWAILLAAAAALLAGCMSPPARPAPEGVRLTPLRTISTLEAKILLRLTGVRASVAYPVDCYRMEYPASDGNGGTVRLSGLLALPRGAPARRLVSFQHGTATTRTAVPSKPDGTGLAAAVVFAGAGYMLIAPDYPGMGTAPGRHPYYVAQAIGPSVTAMIEAAGRLEGAPAAPVFLAGFSEGGWATLAALRMLEDEGRPVLGAAAVAGAYDLRRISLPAAMKGGAPAHSLYLAYLAWGYADHYGRPLDSVLTPAYAERVERLFSGTPPKQIMAELPKDPRAMFDPALLQAFDHDRPHWFLDAVAANDLTDLTPRAPVRLYYGSADLDVVPEESLAAARSMRARGGKVSAVDVGPVGHDPSMLSAAPLIVAWLRELEAAAGG
ncbi:hypothetical protein [Phenylobacterium sp.]|uniref:alpha/beta hydrolase family protein n=1 Tax=Phenylobacterium sp. TaxID=1871053 RepID=UPI00289F3479|nr:hypothetical protein [Phenylobacterium sp.]